MSIFSFSSTRSNGTAGVVMSCIFDAIGLLAIVGLVIMLYVWGVALGFS